MVTSNIKLGFIGYGNMAQAMAKGWIEEGEIQPPNIYASARNYEKLQHNCDLLGINPMEFSEEVVKQSDIIVLAVKPYQIKEVIKPIKSLFEDKVVLSIAAGVPHKQLKSFLPEETASLSLIPNTPVSIGEGILIVENQHSLSKPQLHMVIELLKKLGIVEFIDSDKLSVAGTLAGCGPAFCAMFIEALADGAVKHGLSRKEAYRLASQMLVGTGKLQLKTNDHPGAMKDMVTSPGGTTIKGVAALEENGFRNAVIKALDAIEG